MLQGSDGCIYLHTTARPQLRGCSLTLVQPKVVRRALVISFKHRNNSSSRKQNIVNVAIKLCDTKMNAHSIMAIRLCCTQQSPSSNVGRVQPR